MNNQTAFNRIEDAALARMMRELQSDLADLVESGDLTPEQANEWANRKADQWAGVPDGGQQDHHDSVD